MFDAQQLNEFRKLYDYSRVLLEHFRDKIRGSERRLAVLGAARMALDELELHLVCQRLTTKDGEDAGLDDYPLHILALRDLVCYIRHEVKHTLFVKLYGPQAENYLATLLMVLSTYLKDMGLDTSEIQPDWREEAAKLYTAYQNNSEPLNLNPAGKRYLHQRYRDEE